MAAMNEAAIRKDLNELIETITTSPFVGKPAGPITGVYQSVSGDAVPLDDSVNQLRLQIKYLLFDLEATRRENRYLRQMLDNRHRRKDGDDSPEEGPDFR